MARLNITDGPSKWDLILAIFEGDSLHRREVTFTLEDRGTTDPNIQWFDQRSFMLNGASREDGSGNNWLIHGYFLGATTVHAHGFYSTRTRDGWLEF